LNVEAFQDLKPANQFPYRLTNHDKLVQEIDSVCSETHKKEVKEVHKIEMENSIHNIAEAT